tara:strand:+ start:231 stop:695 length:465 start_codon:yes stop_codon:yes gene_type:complete
MIVKLNPDEVLICEQLGRMRSIIARSSGVKDAKVGDQNGSEADVMGMKAEYAFAKKFNTFPDLGLTPRSGSADGKLKGFAYDVKSTTYKSGRLLATKKENPDVDMYVLCIVDNSEVDIKGYAFKDELIKESNLKNLGHGQGYCLDQDKLRVFKD